MTPCLQMMREALLYFLHYWRVGCACFVNGIQAALYRFQFGRCLTGLNLNRTEYEPLFLIDMKAFLCIKEGVVFVSLFVLDWLLITSIVSNCLPMKVISVRSRKVNSRHRSQRAIRSCCCPNFSRLRSTRCRRRSVPCHPYPAAAREISASVYGSRKLVRIDPLEPGLETRISLLEQSSTVVQRNLARQPWSMVVSGDGSAPAKGGTRVSRTPAADHPAAGA